MWSGRRTARRPRGRAPPVTISTVPAGRCLLAAGAGRNRRRGSWTPPRSPRSSATRSAEWTSRIRHIRAPRNQPCEQMQMRGCGAALVEQALAKHDDLLEGVGRRLTEEEMSVDLLEREGLARGETHPREALRQTGPISAGVVKVFPVHDDICLQERAAIAAEALVGERQSIAFQLTRSRRRRRGTAHPVCAAKNTGWTPETNGEQRAHERRDRRCACRH